MLVIQKSPSPLTKEWLEQVLLEHGCLVLKNTNIRTAQEFEDFVSTASNLESYSSGSVFRSNTSSLTYDPSPSFSPKYRVEPHQEMAYSHRLPSKLFLFCQTPAKEGGESIFANMENVFASMGEKLQAKLLSTSIEYHRVQPSGDIIGNDYIGMQWTSWQHSWGVKTKAEMTALLDIHGYMLYLA